MASIYFFSGPCGCGKTTLANAWAGHLVNRCGKKQVYIIHGDDFHRGFVERDDKSDFFAAGQTDAALPWEDILRFNWECIITVAGKALQRGLDVVIDYVVEGELPLLKNLAREHHARLYYVVLTAEAEEIRRRITGRGDVELIDRALFLKQKLDSMPENQGHLFDNTCADVHTEVLSLDMPRFEVVNIL